VGSRSHRKAGVVPLSEKEKKKTERAAKTPLTNSEVTPSELVASPQDGEVSVRKTTVSSRRPCSVRGLRACLCAITRSYNDGGVGKTSMGGQLGNHESDSRKSGSIAGFRGIPRCPPTFSLSKG